MFDPFINICVVSCILGLILYDLLASYRYMIPDFDLVSMNDIC